ncbi:hypothetical protein POTOM_058712 [Populus tomentosa]|uniref:RING-type domain-containing protein n=1 Tax=Populus tomentosa TaxID=118781 RepID=A0A8X8C2Q1_POPTO|nr:hypothetical protein POTOM_058712 [Populus tomentosa]
MESCGASNLTHAPLTTLLEYSGILGGNNSNFSQEREHLIPSPSTPGGGGHQEATFRIISSTENDHDDEYNASPNVEELPYGQRDGVMESNVNSISTVSDGSSGIDIDSSLPSSLSSSSYQRYDIQNLARWIEHVHPFSLLLLLVFVCQHLQGFCIALWIAAFLFKSNYILRKQTALKVLGGVCSHRHNCNVEIVLGLTYYGLVREVAMVFKCMLLLYYKNGRGHNYRKQVQMLTLVEYLLILYRALLPTPVWHLFFLKKEYGSFFSSLITGLYLTVKLTTVPWKVQLFFTAWRTLPLKEMYYGSYATSEQVKAVGDLCAICQRRCMRPFYYVVNTFCEDCASEWFDGERTCPLCRALIKPADIKSYSDGSTSLFFQLF